MSLVEDVARAIFFRGGEQDDAQWAVMKRQGDRNRHFVLAIQQAKAAIEATLTGLREHQSGAIGKASALVHKCECGRRITQWGVTRWPEMIDQALLELKADNA